MQIANDKIVIMHYKLSLDSGEVLDSSFDRNSPFSFLAGHNQIIPGLEKSLMGMKAGDKKIVDVEPGDGYGERDEKLIQVVPRDQIPGDIELFEGKVLQAQGPQGIPLEVTVVGVTDQEVTIDMNHPLAGERLHFDVEIMEVRDATDEELEHGHSHE
ncbi:peptidylprolyl isomerase [candidate division KSB1 bacterium 4484_87]|nr:MAG: peptidylprolyl isomerase [candidate division KSB1 bacterium 4484_87]